MLKKEYLILCGIMLFMAACNAAIDPNAIARAVGTAAAASTQAADQTMAEDADEANESADATDSMVEPTSTVTATAVPATDTATATLVPPTNTATTIPPTDTATATATPPSPSNTQPLVTASQSAVNLRAGPGVNYEVVGYLPQGGSLTIVGRISDSSWWQVESEKGLSWIAASVTVATNVENVPVVAASSLAASDAPAVSPTNTPVPAVAEAPAPTATPTQVVVPASGNSALEIYDEGLAFFNNDDWASAIAAFETVIQQEPSYAPAHRMLGVSHYLNDNYDAARAPLERYLQLEPDAEDRAQIEKLLRQVELGPNVVITPLGQEIYISEGQGVVIVVNYTADPVVVDVHDQTFELPGGNQQPGGSEVVAFLWPGHYTVLAHAMDGSAAGNAEFDIQAGQVLEWPLYYDR